MSSIHKKETRVNLINMTIYFDYRLSMIKIPNYNLICVLSICMIIFTLGFYDLENKINNFIKNKENRDARTENVATLKLSVTVVTVFQ